MYETAGVTHSMGHCLSALLRSGVGSGHVDRCIRDSTGEGFTRLEITWRADKESGYEPDFAHLKYPTIEAVESMLDRFAALVPANIVRACPHSTTFGNWCRVLNETLVLVDSLADEARLVYAHNKVTGVTAGQVVKGWNTKWHDVLTCNTLGNLPVRIVTVHFNAVDRPAFATKPGSVTGASRRATKQAKALARLLSGPLGGPGYENTRGGDGAPCYTPTRYEPAPGTAALTQLLLHRLPRLPWDKTRLYDDLAVEAYTEMMEGHLCTTEFLTGGASGAKRCGGAKVTRFPRIGGDEYIVRRDALPDAPKEGADGGDGDGDRGQSTNRSLPPSRDRLLGAGEACSGASDVIDEVGHLRTPTLRPSEPDATASGRWVPLRGIRSVVNMARVASRGGAAADAKLVRSSMPTFDSFARSFRGTGLHVLTVRDQNDVDRVVAKLSTDGSHGTLVVAQHRQGGGERSRDAFARCCALLHWQSPSARDRSTHNSVYFDPGLPEAVCNLSLLRALAVSSKGTVRCDFSNNHCRARPREGESYLASLGYHVERALLRAHEDEAPVAYSSTSAENGTTEPRRSLRDTDEELRVASAVKADGKADGSSCRPSDADLENLQLRCAGMHHSAQDGPPVLRVHANRDDPRPTAPYGLVNSRVRPAAIDLESGGEGLPLQEALCMQKNMLVVRESIQDATAERPRLVREFSDQYAENAYVDHLMDLFSSFRTAKKLSKDVSPGNYDVVALREFGRSGETEPTYAILLHSGSLGPIPVQAPPSMCRMLAEAREGQMMRSLVRVLDARNTLYFRLGITPGKSFVGTLHVPRHRDQAVLTLEADNRNTVKPHLPVQHQRQPVPLCLPEQRAVVAQKEHIQEIDESDDDVGPSVTDTEHAVVGGGGHEDGSNCTSSGASTDHPRVEAERTTEGHDVADPIDVGRDEPTPVAESAGERGGPSEVTAPALAEEQLVAQACSAATEQIVEECIEQTVNDVVERATADGAKGRGTKRSVELVDMGELRYADAGDRKRLRGVKSMHEDMNLKVSETFDIVGHGRSLYKTKSNPASDERSFRRILMLRKPGETTTQLAWAPRAVKGYCCHNMPCVDCAECRSEKAYTWNRFTFRPGDRLKVAGVNKTDVRAFILRRSDWHMVPNVTELPSLGRDPVGGQTITIAGVKKVRRKPLCATTRPGTIDAEARFTVLLDTNGKVYNVTRPASTTCLEAGWTLDTRTWTSRPPA